MGGGGGGQDGDFGFQIAPMVDVVFVLLLFFMASAGQQITEGFLKIALPSGQSVATSDVPKVPIVLDIDGAGNVFMGGNPKSASPTDKELTQLLEGLKASMETSPEDPVIIRPASDTRHERLIDVLNSCRQAKVKNLSFG